MNYEQQNRRYLKRFSYNALLRGFKGYYDLELLSRALVEKLDNTVNGRKILKSFIIKIFENQYDFTIADLEQIFMHGNFNIWKWGKKMKNSEIMAKDLLNIISVCVARLQVIQQYDEDDLYITTEDIDATINILQQLNNINITEDIPF